MRQANLRRRHPQVKRADVLGNGAAVKMKTTSASGASQLSARLPFVGFFPHFSHSSAAHTSPFIHPPLMKDGGEKRMWLPELSSLNRVSFNEDLTEDVLSPPPRTHQPFTAESTQQ